MLTEAETLQRKTVRQILKTETIPSPVPVMIRRENILEEKPSPMPLWVAGVKQNTPGKIYFIGTRTRGLESRKTLEEAHQKALEEMYQFLGVKMDYEMRLQSVSSEESEEVQEKRFLQIQTKVLTQIPGLENITEEQGRYTRKIKDPDGQFDEAHVLLSADTALLSSALQKSMEDLARELSEQSGAQEAEAKKQLELLLALKARHDRLLVMSEAEEKAYEALRRRYEVVERSKDMTDLAYQIFLGEKHLAFGNREEGEKLFKAAYQIMAQKSFQLKEIIDTEENPGDSYETRVKKRLKRSEMYFRKGNFIDGYQFAVLALEALLLDYETQQKKGSLNAYLSQLDAKLMEYLEKLPQKRYADDDVVNGKVVFEGEGRGNISAYFSKTGQLLCSKVLEEEGEAYSFYRGDKIIYKMMKLKGRENIRNFALYDESDHFVKEIK